MPRLSVMIRTRVPSTRRSQSWWIGSESAIERPRDHQRHDPLKQPLSRPPGQAAGQCQDGQRNQEQPARQEEQDRDAPPSIADPTDQHQDDQHDERPEPGKDPAHTSDPDADRAARRSRPRLLPATNPGLGPGLGPCRRSRQTRARDRATTEAMRQIRARRIRGPTTGASPERAGRRVANGFAHPSPNRDSAPQTVPVPLITSKRIVGSAGPRRSPNSPCRIIAARTVLLYPIWHETELGLLAG